MVVKYSSGVDYEGALSSHEIGYVTILLFSDSNPVLLIRHQETQI